MEWKSCNELFVGVRNIRSLDATIRGEHSEYDEHSAFHVVYYLSRLSGLELSLLPSIYNMHCDSRNFVLLK